MASALLAEMADDFIRLAESKARVRRARPPDVETIVPHFRPRLHFARETNFPMRVSLGLLAVAVCAFWGATCFGQMPFYTDDPGITEQHVLHFEFYNEYDGLQSSQYPNLNQNTANFKLNYGLPYGLEFDVDIPYINISRTKGAGTSAGLGDTNLGLK